MVSFFSTADLAEHFGFPRNESWRIRRLFEDGTLPEPGRFGGKRAIPAALVPTIEEKLRERGYLPALETIAS